MNYSDIFNNFKIEYDFTDKIEQIESKLDDKFKSIDSISEYNQMKVMSAFKACDLQTSDFNQATGYGYADNGRDKIEAIFSNIFKAS